MLKVKVNGIVEDQENGQCGFRGLLFQPGNIDLTEGKGREEFTLILCTDGELL